MAELYPVFYHLEGKPCLVVGGGRVAYRKVRGLLDAGAHVTVITPAAVPELLKLAAGEEIRLLERPFQGEDVIGHWLVFCATDDPGVNQAVFEASEKAKIPANVADQPHLCRFQVPGRYKEGLLQVAVSTRGGSPALSRRLPQELGDLLTPWAPRLVEWLAGIRKRLKSRKPEDVTWRSDFLNRLVDSHFEKLKAFAEQNDRPSFDAFLEMELREREGEE